ncbi:hypothetical protein HMPREF2758_05520 [Facklamia sp. HMSC062C11]|uniref:hypothetical protein n=1 Tax=Facklamia sp. HMSC062C11 TaxID=1739262 RepID=UPI0008A11DAC|nr:hypothetical protein [Facklamia sp. HMSC062C11]OFL67460.1 hypothetical protein HMPREF2758_05520 [Facklamia sp. HMSC062C11]
MLGKAFKEWKAHFGFYISLITIQVILILLITMVSSWFSPMENMLLNTTDTANTDYSHIIYQLNKDSSWVPVVIGLITSLFTLMLSTLTQRSIFQKLNFPEMRLGDAAYFNTGLTDWLRLPIKLFLLTLFSGLIQAGAFLLLLGPVFLVSGNQMTPMKLGFVTVFALIITLIVSTLFISINYLVAYDVERKYGLWATFTKSIQIGRKYFGRLLGMILLTALLSFVFGALPFILIAFYYGNLVNPILIIGLTVLLVFLLGYFVIYPWIMIYISLVMNEIFAVEY